MGVAMWFLWLSVVFLPLACVTTVQQVEAPVSPVEPLPLIDVQDLHSSHYVGIFQNDRLKKSFPALLDLVVRSEEDGHQELAGVLRVYAAAQDKDAPYRVISSYYDRIILHDKQLSFEQKKQQIRVVKKGRWDQDEIEAYVVVYGFGQGQLRLYRRARTDFSLPLPVAQRPLALPDFRLPHTEFPHQVFTEQLVEKSEAGLLNTSKNLLQKNLFDVSYASIDRFGVYYGVLHHERLHAFQYVRVAFLEDRESGTTTAVSTLFFGAPRDEEFIVYRHRVGRAVMRGVTPLLLGNEGESEAFMLLNRWDRRGIGGVWYSKVYGRIGQIFLKRQKFPRLEVGAVLVPSLRGSRQRAQFGVELQVHNGVAQQAEVVFPARISGTLNDVAQEKVYQVTGGSYDFYRGLVSLDHEGGQFVFVVCCRN